MKKLAYTIPIASALLALAGGSWLVGAIRRPFRRPLRPRPVKGLTAHCTPSDRALGRAAGPSTSAVRQQFALWG